mgnify:CR=1 FL=1|jgi:hypothetical protein|tara:strand:- start:4338 stop:4736 length:399 start_codon:yes stop_codon:yes gene_type:complete
MTNRILKSAFIAVGALLIDLFIHLFFTEPFETPLYFMLKYVIVYILAYAMLFDDKISYTELIAYTIIFVIVWSLYYRLFEFFTNITFGTRAPAFVFGNTIYASNISKAVGWTLVHGAAFFIPAFICKKFIRK